MTHEEQKASQEQIAASLAHEIRNPLALIRSNLQLVQMDDGNHAHTKNYEMIYREIDRINDIVINYIESVRPLRAEFHLFDLNQLLAEIEAIFRHPLAAAGVCLSLDYGESIAINGDYDKLKQVLINLLQNAQESIAPERTDGKISIYVFRTEDLAIINISDNGAGISEYDLASIGTPFFTTKESGTGLGVNISKGIIHLHGGSFNIAGIEGRGSTVSISLPIANAAGEGFSAAPPPR